MRAPLVIIDNVGGNCPLQAEGTINGLPFYYRARWDTWSIGIGGEPILAPAWFYHEEVVDAGWLSPEDGVEHIHQAAFLYAQGHPGTTPV